MASQEDTNHDETITSFINITDAEEGIAKSILEACGWDVGMAVNMYVDANYTASTSSRTIESASAPEPPKPEPVNIDADIRPPIPPVRQVLVDDYHGNSFNFRRNTYDTFRNFEQETRWQEQNLLDDQSSTSSNEAQRNKTFEDLFRPPLDMIYRGPFETAKFEGQRENKWLMVNIQNPQEFACQVLNRDVWSNHAVKSIVTEHFIFWQNNSNTTEGQKYINFYNVATYPYVAILDPRTGEKMVSWSEVDTVMFCDNITQFLSEHPSPIPKEAHILTSNPRNPAIFEESEDLLLKAAIQASLLQDVANSNTSDSDSDTDDDAYQTPSQPPSEKDDWKNYLGSDESPKLEIVIRYPDGNRENVVFPSTSKLKALFLYVSDKGFDVNEFDVFTNFPKKNLSLLEEDKTLESAGISPRDLVYVQLKH